MTDPLDLDRLRAREALFTLLDQVAQAGPSQELAPRIREEMASEPERALSVVRSVLDRAQISGVKIHNPAALITARWKQPALVSLDERRRHEARAAAEQAGPEHEPGPPDLDALEQAWALDPSALATGLLKLMAAAYTRHGGLYDGLRHNARIRDTAR